MSGRAVCRCLDDATVAGLNIIAEHGLHSRQRPRGEDWLTGGWPCYGVYPTAMGAFSLSGRWRKSSGTCCAMRWQMPHLKPLGCSEGIALRVRKELVDRFAAQPLAAWTEFFDGIDCCVTPVLSTCRSQRNTGF